MFNAFPSEATLTDPDENSRPVMVFAPIICRVVIHVYSDTPCSFSLTLAAKRPDGRHMNPTNSQLAGQYEIEGGAQGLTLDVAMTIATGVPGTHWVEVVVDGNVSARWPLLIVHPETSEVRESVPDQESPNRS